MTDAPERMSQKRILLADGRYLIYYSFAPNECGGCSASVMPIPRAIDDKPAEEN
jgi:hypothetical protein